MFCNVNFSNLENILQRKQKPRRTRECISLFRASGGTNFEDFSKFGCGFHGFTGLPNVIYMYIYVMYIYMLYIYKLWIIEYSNV